MASPGGEEVYQVLTANDVWISLTESGIYRSTDDGLSWQATIALTQPYDNSLVYQMASNTLWLLSDDAGVKRSSDDGQTWQAQPGFDFAGSYPEKSLATNDFIFYRSYSRFYRLDPAHPGPATQIYQCTIHPSTGNLADLAAHGNDLWLATNDSLLRSSDDGDSWILAYQAPGDIYTFDLHDNVLLLSTAAGMQRSINYGSTWQTVSSISADGFLKWCNGLWFANDNGSFIQCSSDEGLSWQNCSASLPVGASLRDADRKGNTFILAVANYGLARSADNGATWQLRNSGLGTDPWNSGFGINPQPYAVGDYLNVASYFSQDEGATWFETLGPTADGYSYPLGGNVVPYNGAYFAVDNTRKLYRSVGDLDHWMVISGPYPGTSSQQLLLSNGHFYRIESDQNDGSSVVFETTDNGSTWIPTGTLFTHTGLAALHNWLFHWSGALGLFRSNDGGANWQSIGAGLGVFANSGGSESPRLLAAGNWLFAYDNENILVSTNDGLTFTKINHHLLSSSGYTMGAEALASDGANIAVYTYGGVYYATGLGDQWVPITGNLPAISLNDASLAFYHDFLYANLNYNAHPVWRRAISSIHIAQISGRVWRDDNNNGQQDAGELPYAGAILQAGSASFATSAADGTYQFFADLNTDTLRAWLPIPWVTSHPAFYEINTSTSGRDFGLYFPPGITDLSVQQTNASVFRPGFDEQVYVNYRNLGTAQANGTLRFVAASPLEFVKASPQPDATAGDTLIWNLANLDAGSDGQIIITLHTPAGTPILSTVSTWASLAAGQPDADPGNNEHWLLEFVVGSYDPNDKRSDHHYISPEQLAAGEPIIYTVRFQNTGTYPADFVRIIDLLDTAHLDVTTFRVLATSHACATQLTGAGDLEFLLANINLPPSDFDEPASRGFIRYELRPKANLPLGTDITNTAFIYFDFNFPFVTNTAKTTVSTAVTVHAPLLPGRLQIQPNPAGDRVEIQMDRKEAGQLRIMDATGRTILTQSWPADRQWLDLTALAPGFYWVSWQGASGWCSGKLVKQ